MIDTYRKIIQILDSHERSRGILLFVAFIGFGVVQTVGIAAVMPFMAVVGDTQIIETNTYLNFLYQEFEFRDPNSFLTALGAFFLVVILFSQAYSVATQWLLYRFSQMCNFRLGTRLLATYMRRPYSWFLQNHSAELGKTILGDVEQVVSRVILPACAIVSRVAVAACLFLFIFITDPSIALTSTVVFLGLYAVVYLALRGYLGRIGKRMWEANSQRFRVAQDSLAGIREIKVSGTEAGYLHRYKTAAKAYSRYSANHQIIAMVPKYVMEAVSFILMISIVLIMLNFRQGSLDEALPVFAVYALAGYRLIPALQGIYQDLASIRFGSPILLTLHADLRNARQVDLTAMKTSAVPAMTVDQSIELVNLSYSYPGTESSAISNFNLSIEARSTVGFVGSTGSGKTTAIDLILGLLEPGSGKIMVDGVPIDSTTRERWQRSIGYVPQSIFLTDDSIAANIAFGIDECEQDMELVRQAAKIAELHEYITNTLPDGYETRVGDRGIRLSGGQRQRIGIARALYHNPDVLILDEATSALDNLTERAVMTSLQNMSGQKTIIIVAHRLSTIRDCDSIFLVEQGELVAQGRYEDLYESSEQFRVMATKKDALRTLVKSA